MLQDLNISTSTYEVPCLKSDDANLNSQYLGLFSVENLVAEFFIWGSVFLICFAFFLHVTYDLILGLK